MSDLPSAELESALTWAENADFTSYVFQYPPLAVWSGSPDRAAIRRSWAKAARGGEETGLYVHVPFCRTKCTFCRFFVLEDSGEAGRDAYIRALDREAGLWAPVVKGARFTTLYIGGGTPSLLSAAQLDALFASLRGRFRLSNLAQVSFEANPEFLDERKLGVLRRAGVDRLTLGVQSLDDEVTAAVERSQTNRSVGRVFALAREAGIRSINIDLMTGLPRQTLESFRETFEEVLSWRPDSIHVNPFLPTALTRFAERGGRLGPAALSRSSAMQRYAAERMKRAGFRDLPHDAMALDPRARNIQLEDGVILDRSFLGLGPGAVSRLAGAWRHVNAGNLGSYCRSAGRGRLPLLKSCRLEPRQERINFALNHLWYGRLDRRALARRFGPGALEGLEAPLRELTKSGILAEEAGVGWRIAASRPRARLEVRRALFEPEVVRALLARRSL